MLKLPDSEKYYIVCNDASLEGLGGFLMQYGHVVWYESRKLKEHEKNYVSHDLELETKNSCTLDVETLPHGE